MKVIQTFHIDYKSIIIASPPRTGTIWTLNILREIFLSQKINVIPQSVLRSEKESLKYHFENINSDKNDSISIIKIEKTFLKEGDIKKTKLRELDVKKLYIIMFFL